MLNILIPMSGNNVFSGTEYQYPKPLIEINGQPMIYWVCEMLNNISIQTRLIFMVNDSDCKKFNLDYVLKLIQPDCKIIRIENNTAGAACTCLLAIDEINANDPLIISNADHILTSGYEEYINEFINTDVDAGVICFHSIHPKWSFVRIDDNDRIIEAAEKRPLSKNAIAGIYFFQKASTFFEAAMRMIKKDASLDGKFFISPVLNEIILNGGEIGKGIIPTEDYFNFYSPHKIKEYEDLLSQKGKK